jgi:hypothetical protein
MGTKSIVGIVLIVVGVLGFVFGGIPYTSEETVVDVGPLEMSAEQEKTLPLAPIASGLILVGGVFLVATGNKKG